MQSLDRQRGCVAVKVFSWKFQLGALSRISYQATLDCASPSARIQSLNHQISLKSFQQVPLKKRSIKQPHWSIGWHSSDPSLVSETAVQPDSFNSAALGITRKSLLKSNDFCIPKSFLVD